MSQRRNLAAILALAFAVLPACLVRRREIAPAVVRQNQPLLTATKEELIQRVHDTFDPIQSFLMRADLSPSVTNASKGAAMDYATVGAYILFRKPDDIRVIGQDPVLHSTIFDMVSTGMEFHVYIPRGNRFLVGSNDMPGTSKNKLENLRPAAFLTALMIYPPDPATNVTLLENDTGDGKAIYILLIAQREGDQFLLRRNVYFARDTLQITRQKTFDASGAIFSDTEYSDWKPYSSGIVFPAEIDIRRPQDDYEVQLEISSLEVNTAQVTPDKFILNQPPGTNPEQLK
jgi:hypothetical protein